VHAANVEATSWLLENGKVSVNTKFKEDRTPLIVASMAYKQATGVEVGKSLIAAGAELDAQDLHGRTGKHSKVFTYIIISTSLRCYQCRYGVYTNASIIQSRCSNQGQ
jgi:hypothetical protein